ncbi:EpsG family protein [Butyrivibrio sp. M55]|uniref:EpsG family protein n=1 Tax=Butyrivibrio sp. M55 TaxID=1855323 RepID=UPI0008F3E2D0|nr:EpsG family protein [Butyrivibrio sp. M55]SFU93662.1 EpsG family protein [Butyrivibrio sp. M55]
MFFWILNFYFFIAYLVIARMRGREKTFLILATIHLILVSAFRSVNVGTDTFYYAKAYKYLAGHSRLYWHAMSNSKAFIAYLKACTKILPGINGYVVVTSVPLLVMVAFFIYKYSKNYYLSIWLFVFLYFYFNSLNTARQYLAMSLTLIFFYLFDIKKYFFAMIIGALAVGVHSAALPCVALCVVVSVIKWTPQLTLFTTLGIHFLNIIVPIAVSIFVRILPQYEWIRKYLFSASYSSKGRSSMLYSLYGEVTIILGMYWIFWKYKKIRLVVFGEEIKSKNEIDDHSLQIMQRMMVIVSIATMLYMFYSKVIMFNRMASILFLFIIVLLSNVLANLDGRHKPIMYIFLVPLIAFTYYQLQQGIAGTGEYYSYLFNMK